MMQIKKEYETPELRPLGCYLEITQIDPIPPPFDGPYIIGGIGAAFSF